MEPENHQNLKQIIKLFAESLRLKFKNADGQDTEIQDAKPDQVGFIKAHEIVSSTPKKEVIAAPKQVTTQAKSYQVSEVVQVTSSIVSIPSLGKLLGLRCVVNDKENKYESGIFFTVNQEHWKINDESVMNLPESDLSRRYSLEFLMQQYGYDYLVNECFAIGFIDD